MRTRIWTVELSRLLFSGKGFMTCAFDKYKDCLKMYLKLLIRDIKYMHDLSKICIRELFNLIYIIILAY